MTSARTTAHAAGKVVPWGLVGMLALVLLGERWFARIEMDVIAPWHWDWRISGAAAEKEATKAEILCFGDSLIKFSVMPAIVKERTGLPSFNLGIAVGQPPSSYFLLRRALRSGAKPKAILIETLPLFLAESPQIPRHRRQWPELVTPAELVDLAWTARDANLLAVMTLAKLSPIFRARDELRSAVMDRFNGLADNRRHFAAQMWRNSRVNLGANVMSPGTYQGDIMTHKATFCGAFNCDPLNAAYLDRFFALAASRDIPVFWVIPPMVNELQRLTEPSGFDAAQTAFMQSYQRRYPNVVTLDGRRSDYGRSLYSIDPIHLNRDGALAFSDDLCHFLVRALAGERLPRWVTLPTSSARPSASSLALEDVDQSANALVRNSKVRR